MIYSCEINTDHYFDFLQLKKRLGDYIIEEWKEGEGLFELDCFETNLYSKSINNSINNIITLETSQHLYKNPNSKDRLLNFLSQQTLESIHKYNLEYPEFRDAWKEWSIITNNNHPIDKLNEYRIINPLIYFYRDK